MIRRTDSIPILLLTGFLGAGKTTLINHVLKNSDGLKVGVIINDFGDINIDSMLVSAQTDSKLELSNGCICCSVDESELDDAISQLAHKGSLLDYIIIEASGLAEPRELAIMLRLMKNEYAHFDSVVTVIDAVNFEKNNKAHDSAIDTLAIADIVIINKIDLVSAKKLKDIETGIDLAAPKARIIRSERSAVDMALLIQESAYDKTADKQLTLSDKDKEKTHIHDEFESISFETDKPLDPELFESWASDLPNYIFRAKGICYFGMKGVDQKFIFQAVGKRYELKLDEWKPDEKPKSSLVVIGTNMPTTKVKKQLGDLVDKTPDNINADTLMDVFKYR